MQTGALGTVQAGYEPEGARVSRSNPAAAGRLLYAAVSNLNTTLHEFISASARG